MTKYLIFNYIFYLILQVPCNMQFQYNYLIIMYSLLLYQNQLI